MPLPELGPGEALVAVMASAINYNTVWTSIFEPVSDLRLPRALRPALAASAKRHDLPYHVVGSDLAGVVLQTGPGVHAWKPGDEVVAHCLSVELESPDGHNDTMLDPEQRIWGFETNFGGLAEIALVKSNQLMPKPRPPHLGGGRRPGPGQLHGVPPAGQPQRRRHEAGRQRADLGRLAAASAASRRSTPSTAAPTPVCVVSNEEKAEICRSDGRRADHQPLRGGLQVLEGRAHPGPEGVAPLRQATIRELTGGEDVDIVFEHPGRETFGASVYVARKGGTIVTCASTSGYMHEYDNRYLWMNLKRIIGSHFANYRESWEANRLIAKGMIHPTLSRTYALEDVGQAALDVHRNAPPGQGRRALPGARGGPRRARPGDARPAPRRDQPLPRRLDTRHRVRLTHRFAREPGLSERLHRRHWWGTPTMHPNRGLEAAPGRRNQRMTEGRGLSIFDDEPEDSGESQRQETAADDPTVAIPVGARNTSRGRRRRPTTPRPASAGAKRRGPRRSR